MKLSDCFTGLIVTTMHFAAKLGQDGLKYDIVRDEIEKKVLICRELSKKNGFDPVDFELAEFAVMVLIDEKVLQTDWEGRKEWQKNKLQLKYYKTAFGGSEFYKKLDSLDLDQNEVREVYYLCLTAGFHGRYCLEEDAEERARIIRVNLKRLTGSSESERFLQDPGLLNFSEFSDKKDSSDFKSPGKINYLFPFMGFTLPAVFLFILFMVYRFVLNNEAVTRLVH